MDKLPREMLVKILEMMDNADLETCLAVSELWKHIVNNAIGVKTLVGDEPDFYGYQNCFDESPTHYYSGIEKMSENDTGISCAMLSEIADSDLPIFLFRRQYLIKQLQLLGTISSTNFKKLVNTFDNLRDLTFDLTAFNAVEFIRGKIWINFPRLTYLNVTGDVMAPYWLSSVPNHDILYRNFLTLFLDTEFPKLQTLILLLVPLALTNQQSTLMDALVIFLNKHKYTLRTFEFMNANHMNFCGDSPIIKKIQALDSLQLKTFVFFPTELNPPHIDILFKNTIQSQTSLRYLLDTTSNYSPKLIQQNSSTLVLLDLFINSEDNAAVIDCEIFAKCTALKCLSLIGPCGEDTSRNGSITKTKFLLNTIDQVRFANFNLSTADAADLVTKDWKMLKFLDLQNIGTGRDYGVPFDALCILLATKTIKHVFIFNGMNSYTLGLAMTLSNEYMSDLILDILEPFKGEADDNFLVNVSIDYDNNYTSDHVDDFRDEDYPRHIHIQSLFVYPEWGSIGDEY